MLETSTPSEFQNLQHETQRKRELLREPIESQFGLIAVLPENHNIGTLPFDIPKQTTDYFMESVFAGLPSTFVTAEDSPQNIAKSEGLAAAFSLEYLLEQGVALLKSDFDPSFKVDVTLDEIQAEYPDINLNDVLKKFLVENQKSIKKSLEDDRYPIRDVMEAENQIGAEVLGMEVLIILALTGGKLPKLIDEKGDLKTPEMSRRDFLKLAFKGIFVGGVALAIPWWLRSPKSTTEEINQFNSFKSKESKSAIEKRGINSMLHPEDLTIFARNYVWLMNIINYQKEGYINGEVGKANEDSSFVSLEVGASHAKGLEMLYKLADNVGLDKFIDIFIAIYPNNAIQEMVNSAGNLESFCTMRALKFRKDDNGHNIGSGLKDVRVEFTLDKKIFNQVLYDKLTSIGIS